MTGRCMDKLQGQDYLDYWQTRIARGPVECTAGGTETEQEAQAEAFAAPVRARLGHLTPARVLEFGSGYGRMLKRWRALWPEARLLGVELSHDAIRAGWKDVGTDVYWSGDDPWGRIAIVDVVITCTALQHVTDESLFAQACGDLKTALMPGACLVLIENVSCPGVPHVRDMGVTDYLRAFPQIVWQAVDWIEWHGQEHAAMFGVKR